nr:hypothetical protein Iba_chr04dCG15690 [Ipomoea batatas]
MTGSQTSHWCSKAATGISVISLGEMMLPLQMTISFRNSSLLCQDLMKQRLFSQKKLLCLQAVSLIFLVRFSYRILSFSGGDVYVCGILCFPLFTFTWHIGYFNYHALSVIQGAYWLL